MPIFLTLLMMAQVDPEIAAVQERSRRAAAEKRAAQQQVIQQQAAPQLMTKLPVPAEVAGKFQDCINVAADNADKGLTLSGQWLMIGGGFYARSCQGFAFSRAGRWKAAQTAFEQAANDADLTRDTAAGRLWAQAGNAALAAGDYVKARTSFDAAIARGLPNGIDKGEVYLDRARTLVALGDQAGARTDMDKAIEQAPADPLAWLLSATLARKMGNLALAQKHINEAVRLSSDDVAVALEEGNIAKMYGKDDVAKTAWDRAVKLGADRPEGKAAAANLEELANIEALPPLPPAPAAAAPAPKGKP